MAAPGPDLALTTDLPEVGLPMVYFDAAKLFPADPAARQADRKQAAQLGSDGCTGR